MAKFKQAHRELSIDTPLGTDVLLLTKFSGNESLSSPFEYELDMLSEKPDINFSDILGKNVSVSLSAQAGSLSAVSSVRYFNGYISRFEQTHSEGNIYHYHATMVPWLWFLTRRRDCRIFQNQTVPQIVQQIFSDLGFSSVVENALTATYRTWDYCVQYRETDFDFVSRLLENEGIYYFFKHEKDAQSSNITHKLVLADGVSASVAITGDSTISYLGPDRAAKGEYIRDWKMQQTLQSGNFMLNDYDFTAPKKSLLASAANTAGVVSQTDHRVYDYPGGYTQSSDGSNYVQARMQEQQCGYAVASASSNNRGIETGYLFTLADHPVSTMNQTYLIKSVQYDIRNENYLQSQPGTAETTFVSRLTCFESSQQFRPARITPKALVRGPQTAVVVGPSGEKIYTDEYGRVKVQFYWDTYGTSDQNSSCWIRVSQAWAGAPNNGLNWGDMALPHVGDEVIVDFLEGDPDKPLITGRVYNADNMPPEALPANKHKRIMRDDYGNQIILDATPGDEHIRISSPHHQSELQLGRSVTWNTQSDGYQCTYGNNWSGTFGTAANLVVGTDMTVAVGGYTSAKAGVVYQVTLGPQFNLAAGVNCSADWSDKLEYHDSDVTSISEDDAIIAGGEKACLIGGNGSPAGTSIISLSNSEALMEIGPMASVSPLGTKVAIKLMLIASAVLPIVGSALLAAGSTGISPEDSSAAGGTSEAFIGTATDWNGTDPKYTWFDRGGTALMATGIAIGVAASIWLRKATPTISAVSHGANAYASLKMDDTGAVKIEAGKSGGITLRHKEGKNSVRLVKTGVVSVESPNNNILLKAGKNITLNGAEVRLNGKSAVKLNGTAIQIEP